MQPCEHCKKYAGGCSWTCEDGSTGRTKFEPIKGWTAKKTGIGYAIKSCPEYEDDGTSKKKPGGHPYKYDMDKFKRMMLAGMTDLKIQRRMGGMPMSTISEYKKRVWAEESRAASLIGRKV